ncbi:hypothetical protein MLD38_002794 [Melastoma candidum]|uniref:Uncharacterized protein n=1 Tax=Melastoma candidum TaxID=119954 RepID=A0ACB9RZZ2_9MYRT|nr:hypothetical protein MLD38_002794 [Melastoma candidum]
MMMVQQRQGAKGGGDDFGVNLKCWYDFPVQTNNLVRKHNDSSRACGHPQGVLDAHPSLMVGSGFGGFCCFGREDSCPNSKKQGRQIWLRSLSLASAVVGLVIWGGAHC